MRFTISLSVIAVIHLALQAASLAADPTEPAPPKVKVTIGKETTYITEPLRPDGYPDYVAALNEIYSRGVTPENNAAVLLQQAFGPSDIKDSLRPKFYELLGIKPLPEKGEYFVDETEMLKRWRAGRGALGIPVSDDDAEKMSDEFDRAQERPWKAKEFPIVAEWLALNEKPLALIEQASRRPNCYFPFVAGDAEPPILGGLLLPHLELLRSAAEALVTRAMLQTKQGNIDTAWRDLRDCHRLARLAAKGSTFVDALVGFAIDGMAVSGDMAFAHYSHLPAQRVEQMRAELVALPPVTDIVEKLDVGERFMCLDATASIAQRPKRHGQDCFGRREGKIFDVARRSCRRIRQLEHSLANGQPVVRSVSYRRQNCRPPKATQRICFDRQRFRKTRGRCEEYSQLGMGLLHQENATRSRKPPRRQLYRDVVLARALGQG